VAFTQPIAKYPGKEKICPSHSNAYIITCHKELIMKTQTATFRQINHTFSNTFMIQNSHSFIQNTCGHHLFTDVQGGEKKTTNLFSPMPGINVMS
jgi:hypothetical protein